MPYTQRSKENLVREGIERERIFVTGNPIFEVLDALRRADRRQRRADAVRRRSPAVLPADDAPRRERRRSGAALRRLVDAVVRVSAEHGDAGALQRAPAHRRQAAGRPACSPIRRGSRLARAARLLRLRQARAQARARACPTAARCRRSARIFRVPNVTIRDVTERPETIECGSNILSGADPDAVAAAMRLVLDLPAEWMAPAEVRNTGRLARRDPHRARPAERAAPPLTRPSAPEDDPTSAGAVYERIGDHLRIPSCRRRRRPHSRSSCRVQTTPSSDSA